MTCWSSCWNTSLDNLSCLNILIFIFILLLIFVPLGASQDHLLHNPPLPSPRKHLPTPLPSERGVSALWTAPKSVATRGGIWGPLTNLGLWRDRKLTPTELLEHSPASRDHAISSAWQAAKGAVLKDPLAPSPAVDSRNFYSQVPVRPVWWRLAQGQVWQKFEGQGDERVHSAPSFLQHPWQRLLLPVKIPWLLPGLVTESWPAFSPQPGGSF